MDEDIVYVYRGQWRMYPRPPRKPEPSLRVRLRQFLRVTKVWVTGKGEVSLDCPAEGATTQIYKWLWAVPLYLIYNNGKLAHVRRACRVWKELKTRQVIDAEKRAVERGGDPKKRGEDAGKEVDKTYKGCRL